MTEVSRLPALVVALAWCTSIAAAVVLLPAQPVIGAIAVALALPVVGLALVSRPAIVALAATSYMNDPYAQFSDQVYNVAVLFFSMFAWSLFSGGVMLTVRELLPNTMRLDLLKRRLRLGSAEASATNPAEW